MTLPAGILRERVTIESATDSRNSLGETTQTWAALVDRWAAVEAVSYSERQTSNQTSGTISHSVRMRYVPDLTGKMRVRWGSRLLYISSILERNNREEHELACEERAT
jgi:SPP1 family predicted phage head-tail adaptor